MFFIKVIFTPVTAELAGERLFTPHCSSNEKVDEDLS